MKLIQTSAVALLVGCGLLFSWAQGQQARIGRTDLIHRDLVGDSAHEIIQVRVDFAPGAAFPMHFHPGVEVAYVLEGSLEYQLDDGAPATLKAGDSLFIPAGARHSAKNVGSGNASELATYVVKKGEPLVVVAP